MIRYRSIADGLAQGSDNFLLLRFMAAAAVIYGHASAISGGPAPKDLFVWLGWGSYSGAIAVDLFFAISGFLVAGSWQRRCNLIDFAWARALRVVPAYVACLVVCALLVGPLFTKLPLAEYLRDPGTLGYIGRNLKFGTDLLWNLPGVFVDNPKRATVNGSIWTLPAEVRMYAWVAILGVCGVIGRRWLFNLVLAALLAFALAFPDSVPLVPLRMFLRLAAMFAAGAFCYVNRSWLPLHGGWLLLAAAVAWLCRSTPAYPFLFGACEVLFVFWFAYDTPWRGFNRCGDYSYGVYLWGFPAQQIVAAVAGQLPSLLNALFGFAIALLLAIASWHLLERPALKLKNLPAKLLARWRPRVADARIAPGDEGAKTERMQ